MPLANVQLLSDPSQNFNLGSLVGTIGAGQTLEFQSGTGAATDASAGVYRLTGNFIYRNADPTDYALLSRPGAADNQVNCARTNANAHCHADANTDADTPSPTPTDTPSPTPS